MQTVVRENAWLLHARKYTDTRLLLDFLCEKSGLLSCVYRQPSKTPAPQLFQPLSIEWKGQRELKQLQSLEAATDSAEPKLGETLVGEGLFCGLYLNELLLRSLAKEDSHPTIFHAYAKALSKLNHKADRERGLRAFEFCLLDELGYGIDFSTDIHGVPIVADANYRFMLHSGFSVSEERSHAEHVYSGADVQEIAQGRLKTASAMRSAKKIMRECIDDLLGNKPLRSRELFRLK